MTVIDVSEADFDAEVIERSAHDAGGRRLLGCVVRPVPRADAAARGRGRRRARARSCWRRSTPTPTRGSRRPSASRASPRSRRSATARSSQEFVGAQPRAVVETFFDAVAPSEAELLAAAGDEQSLRGSARARARTRRRGGRARADPDRTRRARRGPAPLLEPVAEDFQADGLRARIRLRAAGQLRRGARGARRRRGRARLRSAARCAPGRGRADADRRRARPPRSGRPARARHAPAAGRGAVLSASGSRAVGAQRFVWRAAENRLR